MSPEYWVRLSVSKPENLIASFGFNQIKEWDDYDYEDPTKTISGVHEFLLEFHENLKPILDHHPTTAKIREENISGVSFFLQKEIPLTTIEVLTFDGMKIVITIEPFEAEQKRQDKINKFMEKRRLKNESQ